MPRKKATGKPGGLEATLAPVVAFVALGAGVIKGLRHRDDVSPADGPSSDQPGEPGDAAFEPLAGVMGKIEAATDRRGLRWIGIALRVQKRFGDLHGNYLAGAISMADRKSVV